MNLTHRGETAGILTEARSWFPDRSDDLCNECLKEQLEQKKDFIAFGTSSTGCTAVGLIQGQTSWRGSGGWAKQLHLIAEKKQKKLHLSGHSLNDLLDLPRLCLPIMSIVQWIHQRIIPLIGSEQILKPIGLRVTPQWMNPSASLQEVNSYLSWHWS